MEIDKNLEKQLRRIGHELNPVVTIGTNGLSENVLLELNRALNDHELIKVKVPSENKKDLLTALQEIGVIVQAIGNIVLLYRAAARPNPKLSNLSKYK